MTPNDIFCKKNKALDGYNSPKIKYFSKILIKSFSISDSFSKFHFHSHSFKSNED